MDSVKETCARCGQPWKDGLWITSGGTNHVCGAPLPDYHKGSPHRPHKKGIPVTQDQRSVDGIRLTEEDKRNARDAIDILKVDHPLINSPFEVDSRPSPGQIRDDLRRGSTAHPQAPIGGIYLPHLAVAEQILAACEAFLRSFDNDMTTTIAAAHDLYTTLSKEVLDVTRPKPAPPKPAVCWGVYDKNGKLVTTWFKRGEGWANGAWHRVDVIPRKKRRVR